MIVQAVLIVLSTRLLGLFTSMAVGLELAIIVVLVLGLGAVMVFTGSGDMGNLTLAVSPQQTPTTSPSAAG